MTDWSPLAGSDPIPGDPGTVQGLVQRMESTARALQQQSTRLDGVSVEEFWKGLAADAFKEHQQGIVPLLNGLTWRYERVAGALNDYWPALADAQSKARQALAQAQQAQQDEFRAQQGLAERHQFEQDALRRANEWNAANPGSNRHPDHWVGPNWGAALSDAQASLGRAQDLLRQAISERDNAADQCASRINDACDDSLKDPGGLVGFFERDILNPIEQTADAVAPYLKYVTAVLAVVSLVVPGLGEVVMAAAVLQLAADSVEAAQGKEGWGTVLGDALGIVAPIGLAKLSQFMRMGSAGEMYSVMRSDDAAHLSGRFFASNGKTLVSGAAAGGPNGTLQRQALNLFFKSADDLHSLYSDPSWGAMVGRLNGARGLGQAISSGPLSARVLWGGANLAATADKAYAITQAAKGAVGLAGSPLPPDLSAQIALRRVKPIPVMP